MTLRDFLHTFRITQTSMAEDLGVTVGTLNAYVHGRITPSLQTALSIEKLTAGHVTVYDWGVKIPDGVRVLMNDDIKKPGSLLMYEVTRRIRSELGLLFEYMGEVENHPISQLCDETEIAKGSASQAESVLNIMTHIERMLADDLSPPKNVHEDEEASARYYSVQYKDSPLKYIENERQKEELRRYSGFFLSSTGGLHPNKYQEDTNA